jgi:hypothetical protein
MPIPTGLRLQPDPFLSLERVFPPSRIKTTMVKAYRSPHEEAEKNHRA